tara:strand:- start:3882 stop:4607 length:726 start_codon:yes stop_codon:yes gene_type:complete
MRINYNFAFKNSRLREWERPAPPNLLITDVSLKKKILYIFKEFNNNSDLFYPSTLILIITLGINLFSIYPSRVLNTLEGTHKEYSNISNRLKNINKAKNRLKTKITNMDEYFTQSTTSYLFSFYLQNSVPKDVRLNSYSFSDNGFEINASSFSIDSLSDFLTLIIESPVIDKKSVNLDNLQRNLSNQGSDDKKLSKYEIEIYGDVLKIDTDKRQSLYEKSNAAGLLIKFKRFNNLKSLLGS